MENQDQLLVCPKETYNCRSWESSDYTISKLIVKEGDMCLSPPRIGCSGQFKIDTSSISLTGVEWEKLNTNPELSQYLNKNSLIDHNEQNSEEPSLVGKFRIGLGDTDIDRSIEQVLRTMYPGEKCELSLRLKLNMAKRKHLVKLLDTQTDSINNLDAYHWITIQLTLELIEADYKNRPAIYAWRTMDKLSEAKQLYDSAITLFQNRRYLDAFLFFRQALNLCYIILHVSIIDKQNQKDNQLNGSVLKDFDDGYDVELETKVLKEKCISNITACHFQWSNHQYVVCLASERLTAADENKCSSIFGTKMQVKAFFRRAVANAELKNYDLAINDLKIVLKLDPTNKAAAQRLQVVNADRQKSDLQMGNAMKKMFL